MSLREKLESSKSFKKMGNEILERARTEAQFRFEIADRLRDEIKMGLTEGGTTGDRITDFCILNNWQEEHEGLLRDLDSKIKSHQGELALVIKRSEENIVCRMPSYGSLPSDYRLQEQMFMGLIAGEDLILKGNRVYIPTGKLAKNRSLKNNAVQEEDLLASDE
jgi:hypothetical protein